MIGLLLEELEGFWHAFFHGDIHFTFKEREKVFGIGFFVDLAWFFDPFGREGLNIVRQIGSRTGFDLDGIWLRGNSLDGWGNGGFAIEISLAGFFA